MTEALFLSPHNDDETLFGAFTLLRHQPRVVVCFRSDVQENRHRFGVTASEREAETAAALDYLGCEWEQWPYLDSIGVDELRTTIRTRFYEMPLGLDVFAPALEDGGQAQHNLIAEEAARKWGGAPNRSHGGSLTHYMTYTNGRGRSTGVPVEYENGWVARKLRALACYESQIRLDSTGHHFAQALHEWYQP